MPQSSIVFEALEQEIFLQFKKAYEPDRTFKANKEVHLKKAIIAVLGKKNSVDLVLFLLENREIGNADSIIFVDGTNKVSLAWVAHRHIVGYLYQNLEFEGEFEELEEENEDDPDESEVDE